MLPELTSHEVAAALDAVAEKVLAAAGVSAPPVDAHALAAELGLSVALDDLQPGRARFVRSHREWAGEVNGAILIRNDPRPERMQWAVAHEIGESQAWQVFAALGVNPAEAPQGAREEVASALASALLLPTRRFMRDLVKLDGDIPLLKQRYQSASHELIARRLLDLGGPSIVTIWDQGKIHWRRGKAGRCPPLCPLEQECLKALRADRMPQQREEEGIRVQGWAVDEPGWLREILRTTWDEC